MDHPSTLNRTPTTIAKGSIRFIISIIDSVTIGRNIWEMRDDLRQLGSLSLHHTKNVSRLEKSRRVGSSESSAGNVR